MKNNTMISTFKYIANLIKSVVFLSAVTLNNEAKAQLQFSNGDTLYISPGEQLHIQENMNIPNGAVIINNASAGINLSGSAIIDGEIDYTAAGNQLVLPYLHRNLRIGGSGSKILASDLTITNQLTLGGTAKLVTANHLLSLDNINTIIAGSNPIGNDAGSWIVTGNGNPGIGNAGTGGLKITGIGSAGRNGDVLFPVGPTISKYNPIILHNNGITDDYTVAVNDQVVPGADPAKSILVTWNISEANMGGSDVALTTQWTAADEAASFIRNICGIVHSNGSTIDYHAAVGAAAGTNLFVKSGVGFTRFSPFGVTSDGIVLPVTFIRLNAQQQQESVNLEWKVAAETGIAYYEVQRSQVNSNFNTIGNVIARNSSGNLVSYNWTDLNPNAGVNFYRIRSVGINGTVKYSAVAKVNYTGATSGIAVYPNPVINHKLTLEFKSKPSGTYYIAILSTTGSLVYQTKITHNGANQKYLFALPVTMARELYQLNINEPNGGTSQIKIMIHH